MIGQLFELGRMVWPASVGQTDSPATIEPEAGSGLVDTVAGSAIHELNTYAHVFVIAFLVTLLATPFIRKLAIRYNVIDHPDEARKIHREPIAYLGGVAVFLGLLAAIVVGWATVTEAEIRFGTVLAVIVGMVAITLTGVGDDVWGWDPRSKIAGQLVAAAALAAADIGNGVATGILQPLIDNSETLKEIAETELLGHNLYHWVGTVFIGLFVLGGCNSANLIDGLDGLLSGVIAIAGIGLLAISLLVVMAAADGGGNIMLAMQHSGPRLLLCAALVGAVLGFLPHNFNPASIFLGDAGSLLLGYMVVVIILMLGQTHLVVAGLIVFSIPIMDTTLAIIRRKLSGQSMSTADTQHIHHQMKRATGGVKRAVLALYAIGITFAVIGVSLAALVLDGGLRVRAVYAIALVLFGFIGVMAVKAARREHHQEAISQAVDSPRKKAS